MLALAMLGAASCTNNVDDGFSRNQAVSSDGMCRVTFKAATFTTRGTRPGAPSENRIDNIQVFIFRNSGGADQGLLDASGIASGATVDVSCTAGEKIIYAVTNAPEISGISSVDDLKAVVTNLSDNLRANLLTEKFVMVGSTEEDLDFADSQITVEVTRLVAKVQIGRIDFDMSSAYYQNSDIVFKRAYLTNAVSVAHLDEAYTPVAADYLNKGAFVSNSADRLLCYAPNEEIDPTDPAYSCEIVLYAYPNPSEGDDTSLDPWTIRRTRLVLECTFNSELYYYPIDLPALESNLCYEIDNITITRPGGKTPDEPVQFGDLTFNLTITDWTTTTLSDGTLI